MQIKKTALQAALGFRAHSGWAVVVALSGPAQRPIVLERRRIEIVDPAIPGSKQPYHAAEGWPLSRAEKFLNRCISTTDLLAHRAVSALVAELREKGHEVVGCGLVAASGRPLPSLAAILASHALIHAAEGELFRNALIEASTQCKLTITRVRAKELFVRGAQDLGLPLAVLQHRLAELGRPLGPPWTQDEKFAALVSWIVLAASKGSAQSTAA